MSEFELSSNPEKISAAEPPLGVLDRGLHILECFSLERPRLQLRDIAAVSGLDKATASRALKSLEKYGFLDRSDDGFYSPGAAPLRLAAIFRATSNLVTRLERPIEAIAQKSGHAAALFIRSGDQRVCLIRDRQRRDFRYFVEVGASVPIREGGAAAHILAAYTDFELDAAKAAQAREDGFYISRGERNEHLISAALPVFEADGEFVGAVATTSLRSSVKEEDITRCIEIVRQEIETARLSTRGGLWRRQSDPSP